LPTITDTLLKNAKLPCKVKWRLNQVDGQCPLKSGRWALPTLRIYCAKMPNYRRAKIPGSTIFLTWVTHRCAPLFSNPDTVAILRQAVAIVQSENPFEIVGAAILPDHIHFLWTLPSHDFNYSKRVGRIKVLFSRAFQPERPSAGKLSASRQKHQERDAWQRRFWEHTIRDEDELSIYLDYIHYNPVKHGLVSCPHLWPYSSFQKWVDLGCYQLDWGYQCGGKIPFVPDFSGMAQLVGE